MLRPDASSARLFSIVPHSTDFLQFFLNFSHLKFFSTTPVYFYISFCWGVRRRWLLLRRALVDNSKFSHAAVRLRAPQGLCNDRDVMSLLCRGARLMAACGSEGGLMADTGRLPNRQKPEI
jgi:hypothetical protein